MWKKVSGSCLFFAVLMQVVYFACLTEFVTVPDSFDLMLTGVFSFLIGGLLIFFAALSGYRAVMCRDTTINAVRMEAALEQEALLFLLVPIAGLWWLFRAPEFLLELLAKRRGQSVEWAIAAIREGKSDGLLEIIRQLAAIPPSEDDGVGATAVCGELRARLSDMLSVAKRRVEEETRLVDSLVLVGRVHGDDESVRHMVAKVFPILEERNAATWNEFDRIKSLHDSFLGALRTPDSRVSFRDIRKLFDEFPGIYGVVLPGKGI